MILILVSSNRRFLVTSLVEDESFCFVFFNEEREPGKSDIHGSNRGIKKEAMENKA